MTHGTNLGQSFPLTVMSEKMTMTTVSSNNNCDNDNEDEKDNKVIGVVDSDD